MSAAWFLLITIAPLLLQLMVCGWSRSALRSLILRPSRSQVTDWTFFVMTITNIKELAMIAFSLGAALLLARGSRLAQLAPWRIEVSFGSVLLEGVFFYLLFTFADYWNHRLWHTKAGWLLHRMHHSGETYSPLLAQRNHPLQLALEPIVRVWPLVFFDFDFSIIATVAVIDALHQSLVHTDLPWSWGVVGRWAWMSPAGHKVHHSSLPEHAHKNFGTIVLWDRVFGTWYDGNVLVVEVGIAGNVHNQRSLLRELISDTLAFCRALGRTISGVSSERSDRWRLGRTQS
jgi:sterol desaturase/sphingolipid hydroxylase (fatty acid hydroxylase superfamily)